VPRRRSGPRGLTDDQRAHAQAWAERFCLDQHLPLKITDSRTLRDVANLLGGVVARSDPPDGGQPGVVEAVVASPAGADDDVVEDGGDDRVLPGEGQVGPALPQRHGGGESVRFHTTHRGAAGRVGRRPPECR
jgi:hypothetical protein